jgi:TRAP-type C4-dicarboxylate transport system permease small subunit
MTKGGPSQPGIGANAGRAVLRPVAAIDAGLARIEAATGFLILLALIVVLSLQVASRQLPVVYVPWTEEVSRLLFGWLAFIGTALAFQRRAHISITILADRAPIWLRAGIQIVVLALIVGFAAIMLVYGLRLCLSTRMVTTVLQLPMWVIYAAIPTSGALMIWHGLVAMLRIALDGAPRATGSVVPTGATR